MRSLSNEAVQAFGKEFIDYLCEANQLKTWSKPDLRVIYQEFRAGKASTPCYSSVLFTLSRRAKLVKVTNGHVFFKGTADWSTKQSRVPIAHSSASPEIIGERQKIIKALRKAQAKDRFLVSSWIQISCNQDIEKSPGYFTCDLGSENQAQFQILIRNIGMQVIHLEKCLFLKNNAAMKLSDTMGCTSLAKPKEVIIKPSDCYEITVTCQIKEEVGSYCGDLFFRCTCGDDEGFLVMRYLRCFRSDDIVKMTKPVAPYIRRKIVKDDSSEILPGEKLTSLHAGNKLIMSRQLKNYEVPSSVRSSFERKVFSGKASYLFHTDHEMLDLLKQPLDFANYARKFSLLLQIEEKQAEIDIRHYDLISVGLIQEGRRFLLKVPGLAERRPSVLRGDKIYLRQSIDGMPCSSIKFQGYVHEVRMDEVLLGLHANFVMKYVRNMKFNVTFTFNRLPIKLQHRAVESLTQPWFSRVLFPESCEESMNSAPELRTIYNRLVAANKEQSLAVKWIVNGTSRVPYVIYGPPGTGKTVTMVEAIKQVVQEKKKTVLVCAPSNSACDLLVERLLEHVDKKKIYRMHALSRPWKDVPEALKPVSNYDKMATEYVYPMKQELLGYRVLATTLVTAGRLSSAEFPSNHFDYIFIDEAGHAVEPECMIAVDSLLAENGRLVLAGDPKQLGPILRSPPAIEFGLGKSYLERLMECEIYQLTENGYQPEVITKLLNNYRSHEAILEIPNECFYDGELETKADIMIQQQFCLWEHLPKRNFPIVFHGVKGEDQREENSPSFFNPQEASVVYDYVKKILETRRNPVQPSQIGIISPYRKQVQKLREVLKVKKLQGRELIKVGSVEEFQGQERRVIIISTVRSNCDHLPHDEKFQLGFLKNEKRFNVAITRAMSLLVVIGNPEVLCKDKYWNKFLTYCEENGGYTGISFQRQREDIEDDMDEVVMRMKSIGLTDHLLDENGEISRLQGEVDPPWRDDM